MKYIAGPLRVAYAQLVILMLCMLTGSVKISAARPLCQLKELTELTKSEVKKTLESFDKANGGNLGIWSPGFPLLPANQSGPLHGPEVQCSLHFMAKGLKEIKEDQKTDLNPTDVYLDKLFEKTIFRVKSLALCVKFVLKGECSNEPSPPIIPKHAFEKKQWSRTLLISARDYLTSMKHRLPIQSNRANVKSKQKTKSAATKERLKYLSGSHHQL